MTEEAAGKDPKDEPVSSWGAVTGGSVWGENEDRNAPTNEVNGWGNEAERPNAVDDEGAVGGIGVWEPVEILENNVWQDIDVGCSLPEEIPQTSRHEKPNKNNFFNDNGCNSRRNSNWGENNSNKVGNSKSVSFGVWNSNEIVENRPSHSRYRNESRNRSVVTNQAESNGGVSIERLNVRIKHIINQISQKSLIESVHKFNELPIRDEEALILAANLVITKVVTNSNKSDLVADFCKSIATIQDMDGRTFKKVLLHQCQSKYEENRRAVIKLNESGSRVGHVDFRDDLYFDPPEDKLRIEFGGIVKFLGSLYKVCMLNCNVIINCLKQLYNQGDEISLECFCILFGTVGKAIDDSTTDFNPDWDRLCTVMKKNVRYPKEKISRRIRNMMQELVNFKSNNWLMDGKLNNPVQPTTSNSKNNQNNDLLKKCREVAQTINTKNNFSKLLSRELFETENLTKIPPKQALPPEDHNQPSTSKACIEISKNEVSCGGAIPKIKLIKKKKKKLKKGPERLSGRLNYSTQFNNEPDILNYSKVYHTLWKEARGKFGYRRHNSRKFFHSKTLQNRTLDYDLKNQANISSSDSSNCITSRTESIRTIRESREIRLEQMENSIINATYVKKFQRKTKDLLRNYMNKKSKNNTKAIREVFYGIDGDLFLSSMILFMIENQCRSDCRVIGKLLVQLAEEFVISSYDFVKEFSYILDIMGSPSVKIPVVHGYFSEILTPLFAMEILNFDDLKRICLSIKHTKFLSMMLAELLRLLLIDKDHHWMQSRWNESGVRLDDFILSQDLSQFILNNELEFLFDLDKDDVPLVYIERRIYLLLNTSQKKTADFSKSLLEWANTIFPTKQKTSVFIEALTLAILKKTLTHNGLKNDWLKEYMDILRKFIDNNDNLETILIFATQNYILDRLIIPGKSSSVFLKELFCKVLNQFHNCEVIKKTSLNKWMDESIKKGGELETTANIYYQIYVLGLKSMESNNNELSCILIDVTKPPPNYINPNDERIDFLDYPEWPLPSENINQSNNQDSGYTSGSPLESGMDSPISSSVDGTTKHVRETQNYSCDNPGTYNCPITIDNVLLNSESNSSIERELINSNSNPKTIISKDNILNISKQVLISKNSDNSLPKKGDNNFNSTTEANLIKNSLSIKNKPKHSSNAVDKSSTNINTTSNKFRGISSNMYEKIPPNSQEVNSSKIDEISNMNLSCENEEVVNRNPFRLSSSSYDGTINDNSDIQNNDKTSKVMDIVIPKTDFIDYNGYKLKFLTNDHTNVPPPNFIPNNYDYSGDNLSALKKFIARDNNLVDNAKKLSEFSQSDAAMLPYNESNFNQKNTKCDRKQYDVNYDQTNSETTASINLAIDENMSSNEFDLKNNSEVNCKNINYFSINDSLKNIEEDEKYENENDNSLESRVINYRKNQINSKNCILDLTIKNHSVSSNPYSNKNLTSLSLTRNYDISHKVKSSIPIINKYSQGFSSINDNTNVNKSSTNISGSVIIDIETDLETLTEELNPIFNDDVKLKDNVLNLFSSQQCQSNIQSVIKNSSNQFEYKNILPLKITDIVSPSVNDKELNSQCQNNDGNPSQVNILYKNNPTRDIYYNRNTNSLIRNSEMVNSSVTDSDQNNFTNLNVPLKLIDSSISTGSSLRSKTTKYC